MAVQVRQFHDGDAAAVAAVMFDSVRHGAVSDYSPEQVRAWMPAPPTIDQVLEWAGSGRVVVVAVADDGAVVGWGDLTPEDHIDHIFCCPAVIGQGVGSALHGDLERRAVARGARRVTVHASELARRLFDARGFVTTARQEVVRNGGCCTTKATI